MIQVKNVVDALYGLIGWRKDLSDNINIDDSLVASESGLYYQDAHSLLTLKNLMSIAPDFSNRQWDEWVATVSYPLDKIVSVTGEQGFDLFRCVKTPCLGQDPNSPNSEYWVKADPFSIWLGEKTRASIANAISHFVYSSMPKGGTATLVEHRLLFNSVGRISDRIASHGNVVGLEAHPIHNYDACVKLHKIGLQALVPANMKQVEEVTLKVKSSNDMLNNLVAEKVVTGGYQTNFIELNKDVANTYGGQSLYAFYDQRDLDEHGIEAINRTIDWSKAPCPACNIIEHQAYLAWSKYIEVHPFYIEPSKLIMLDVDDFTFDQQDLVYTNMTNFGLNLELSVYCDYTDFIIRNKSEFIPLLLKQMAVDMLKEFAYNANVRANRNSVNISRQDVVFALEGNSDTQGLFKELEHMYKGLNVSTKGLDKVCRPCCNNGLRYTTT